MAEVVNLNKFRKAKARTEKEQRAQTNRITHGTPKSLKDIADANKALKDKELAGKKLGDDGKTAPDAAQDDGPEPV